MGPLRRATLQFPAPPLIINIVCLLLSFSTLNIAVNGAAGQGRKLAMQEPEGHQRSLAAPKRPVFMEYIGGGGAALADVPVRNFSSVFDFYFILAFATDASTTNGTFNATWQPRLSPANIAAVKATHPGVKFSASIGGGNPNAIFQPTSVNAWVDHAFTTLSGILSKYKLDGIDIDFESFRSSEADFAICIGMLITKLKQKGLITIATIAPYPGTDAYYMKLWETYNHTIDYVNYQFYSRGDMAVSEYVSEYKTVKGMYPGGTVLASFETVNNGTTIIPAASLDGCKRLKKEGELYGIFIWSADQSYDNFQYEKNAQSLLMTKLQ